VGQRQEAGGERRQGGPNETNEMSHKKAESKRKNPKASYTCKGRILTWLNSKQYILLMFTESCLLAKPDYR